MPKEASIEDCKSAYELSHSLGVKANALYRDGSKLSQPLSSSLIDEEDEISVPEEAVAKEVILAEKVIEKIAANEIRRSRENYQKDVKDIPRRL